MALWFDVESSWQPSAMVLWFQPCFLCTQRCLAPSIWFPDYEHFVSKVWMLLMEGRTAHSISWKILCQSGHRTGNEYRKWMTFVVDMLWRQLARISFAQLETTLQLPTSAYNNGSNNATSSRWGLRVAAHLHGKRCGGETNGRWPRAAWLNCTSIAVVELWNHTHLEWRRAPALVQRFPSKAHRRGPRKVPKCHPHLGLVDWNWLLQTKGGSVAKWLVCWTQARKRLGSNRSRDAVG